MSKYSNKTVSDFRDSGKKTVKFLHLTDVSLSDLRAMPSLNSDVDQQLSALGLQSESSESDSSSQHREGERADSVTYHDSVRTKSKTKTLKSGLYKKSADTVKFPQIWPHSALQYEFVSESVSFMSLDIRNFVAGEVEIVLSNRVSAVEKMGRLRLLKKMMYYANIYEWRALLKFYAARVRRIEIGLSTWSDDSTEIEMPMLARFPLRTKSQLKKEGQRDSDQLWWCPDYNKQSCSSSALVYQKHIKGQLRTVRHFCSACFKGDKAKLEHPQSSSACPYYKK